MTCRIVTALRANRTRREAEEREKMARVEQAERELDALLERKEKALGTLAARDKRNHWQESIQIMIHGRAS